MAQQTQGPQPEGYSPYCAALSNASRAYPIVVYPTQQPKTFTIEIQDVSYEK